MKRFIGKIFFFFWGLLFVFFAFPSNTNALQKNTSYININDNSEQSLEIGCLSFSNLTYVDNSLTIAQSFGLTGNIVNESKNNVNYEIYVTYYDRNYNEIAESTNTHTALVGSNTLNQMSSIKTLKKSSIGDIVYYKLEVNIPDYAINKYDINMVVNENNTYDITEKITVYFNAPSRGITREIPLRNKITDLVNSAEVTNVSVNDGYTALISVSPYQYNIDIGSDNRRVTGEQTYVIKYTYNVGKDAVKDYDELYFDLICNEWHTVINNITFTIIMPKKFDSSKLVFLSNIKDSNYDSNVDYNINEKKITGRYMGVLNADETLTVRCELPEGYFVGARLITDVVENILFIIPILFLIISIILKHKFGYSNQKIETVEYYPPEGLNSLDVGFLYKGRAENKDIISLVLYLANKGYIQIVNKDMNWSKMKKLLIKIERTIRITESSYIIKKLKDYDGDNLNEKIFMKALFGLPVVNDRMLRDNFYYKKNSILYDVNSKVNKDKILIESSPRKMIIAMMLISYILITVPKIIFVPGNIFESFCTLLLPLFVYISLPKRKYSLKLISVGVVLSFIPFFSIIFSIMLKNPPYLVGHTLGVICIFGMAKCLKSIPKRTSYGNEMLMKIKAFKYFLQTAEKEKLEALIMENPNYFYDILPYAYALGISNKWIKKFEIISLKKPTWFDIEGCDNSTNSFDANLFRKSINSTMSSIRKDMTSEPYSNYNR